MSLKNLMVHLDQGPRVGVRLELAVALAQTHAARLVGVFGQRARAKQVGTVASWPSDEYLQAAAEARARFEAATKDLPQSAWHDVNRGGDAELLRQISATARYGDLMILGQHEEGAANLVPMELPEEVMTHSGRPILVMPYAGTFPTVGRRPIIAWSGSRRSARALADALPLMRGCESATLVSMDSDHNDAEVGCRELTTYLATHGITVRTELLASEDIGIMDLLLNTVTDHGADLLVMGGRQQATLPFGNKGAGTRHILQQMTVPVLMSCG